MDLRQVNGFLQGAYKDPYIMFLYKLFFYKKAFKTLLANSRLPLCFASSPKRSIFATESYFPRMMYDVSFQWGEMFVLFGGTRGFHFDIITQRANIDLSGA